MVKVTKQHQVSNSVVWRDTIEARCNCGRTIALCAATYVSFCDDEGMKISEEQATFVLLNCHAIEHGRFPQTLMVSLFEMAVAA